MGQLTVQKQLHGRVYKRQRNNTFLNNFSWLFFLLHSDSILQKEKPQKYVTSLWMLKE